MGRGPEYDAATRARWGHEAATSSVAVARRLSGIPKSTISNWKRIAEQGGNFETKGRSGRPQELTKCKATWIAKEMVKNRARRMASPKKIATILSARDPNITEYKVRQAMKLDHLKRSQAAEKPMLQPQDMSKRLQYAKEAIKINWRRIVATDEKPLRMNRTNRPYITRRAGERLHKDCLAPKIPNQQTMQVWGGIFYGGRTDLVWFDCSYSKSKNKRVTGEIYVDQVYEAVLSPLWQHLRGARRGYLLLEDGAPIHRDARTQQRRQELGIDKLLHPPYSPDLNPIENVWAILEHLLDKVRNGPNPPKTLDELWKAAEKCWWSIPQEKIDNILGSWEKRMQAVIDAEGGHIDY